MATPNYGYEKRQKELAKKRKKEDKLKAKAERKSDSPDSLNEEGSDTDPLDAGATPESPDPAAPLV